MNNQIPKLLDKYFNGETSLQEEQMIQEYFQGEQVDPSLKVYQPLFSFIQEEKEITLDEGFDEKILGEIQKKDRRVKIRHLQRRFIRVAAVVSLVLLTWFTYSEMNKPKQIDWAKYEIKDPQKAFETTKAALIFASSKLNQGTSKAVKQTQKLEKVSKYFK